MSGCIDNSNAELDIYCLPKVGTKIEFIRNTSYEYRETAPADGTVMLIVAHYHDAAVCCWQDADSSHAETFTAVSLYPIGTYQQNQANKRREDICDRIFGVMSKAERKDNRSDMAEAVYDAIAAGEIPHIILSITSP